MRLRACSISVTLGLLMAALGWLAAVGAVKSGADVGSDPAAPPPLPGYLEPVVDPASGNTFVRITSPSPGPDRGFCVKTYCTHRYSSSQAWNADQTLLLIANGCGGFCFLDGQTYRPLFRRQRDGECEWSPTKADLMICVTGRSISLWAPRTNRDEVVYTTTVYRQLQFGPGKGNPSRDGNRIAVRAVRPDGRFDAFVFDFTTRSTLPVIHISELPGKNDSCSISPLGTYVVCFQGLPDDIDNAFIFSADGKPVQGWREHHRPGHGDMTVDDNGDEVYVGISKSEPDLYQVIKRRLKDGVVTSLAPYGEGQHVSLRAVTKPPWAFVSYSGYPDEVVQHPTWAPFAQQVVAMRLDGSEKRVVASTRDAPHDYWSETHASPSPDGSQVIWSSNWGKPGGPVFDFVTRLAPSSRRVEGSSR